MCLAVNKNANDNRPLIEQLRASLKLERAKNKMLEKTIKLAVQKRLKELGPECYSHWPVQLGMGDRCLDCHGCYRGDYFAIETKRPGAKPTAIQQYTIEKIQKAGGLVFVIDSKEAAHALFSDRPPPLAEITHPLRPRLRVVARRSNN
jgi:hypothetical protein